LAAESAAQRLAASGKVQGGARRSLRFLGCVLLIRQTCRTGKEGVEMDLSRLEIFLFLLLYN